MKPVAQEDGHEMKTTVTWGFVLAKFNDAQSQPIINKKLWDNSVFVPESTLETQLFLEPHMQRIRWRGRDQLAPSFEAKKNTHPFKAS